MRITNWGEARTASSLPERLRSKYLLLNRTGSSTGFQITHRRFDMSGLWQLLGDVVPSDSCAQSCITMFATEVARERTYQQVLDLGCGLGTSYDLFKRLMPCAH